MERTVLIAGATGAVAKRLTDLLAGDPTWSVVGLCRNPPSSIQRIRWVSADLGDAGQCRRALAEYHVGGIRTNLAFHRRVMRHPAFVAGDTDTGFIERHKQDLLAPATPTEREAEDAAIAAALQAARAEPAPLSADGATTEPSAWRRGLGPK